MSQDFGVIVSDSILEGMEIYTTVTNPNKVGVGMLILTGNMEEDSTRDENKPAIVKFYYIQLRGSEYHVENKIQTFEFDKLKPATEFLKNLSTMSALDLLLLRKSNGSDLKKDPSVIYQ